MRQAVRVRERGQTEAAMQAVQEGWPIVTIRDMRAEVHALRLLVDGQASFLLAYRTGGQPKESAFDNCAIGREMLAALGRPVRSL